MRVDEMHEADINPKGHDERRIKLSIERWGFLEQPVLDERTGKLVHGHGRLHQLVSMLGEGQDPPDGITTDKQGHWLWPVTRGWSSRSDEEALQVGVALNRLTEVGGWADLEGLTGILDAANDLDPALLDVIGYSSDELDDLHATLEETGGVADPQARTRDGIPERLDAYEHAGTHTIILVYSNTVFGWAIDKLGLVAEQRGFDSNAEVVLALLSEAVGESPPPGSALDGGGDADAGSAA
jgi:hypothetical protein